MDATTKAYQNWKAESAIESEAHNKKWTYQEAVEVERARDNVMATCDYRKQIELNKVLKLVEASHKRGDFKCPNECMSRGEARRLLTSIGVPEGKVYSELEADAIFNDTASPDYGDAKKAWKEGRVVRADRPVGHLTVGHVPFRFHSEDEPYKPYKFKGDL